MVILVFINQKEAAMREIVEVDYGSSRYDELAKLRYKILLEPLGFEFLDAHRSKEANYLHLACIEKLDDALLGGCMLAPVDNEVIRLMQVAVDNKYLGEGIGRELVKYAEARAKEAGYSQIEMHAMLSVVDFYEKQGYVQEGDLIEEKGVSFAKMVKKVV